VGLADKKGLFVRGSRMFSLLLYLIHSMDVASTLQIENGRDTAFAVFNACAAKGRLMETLRRTPCAVKPDSLQRGFDAHSGSVGSLAWSGFYCANTHIPAIPFGKVS
jgi:hypothetical protein